MRLTLSSQAALLIITGISATNASQSHLPINYALNKAALAIRKAHTKSAHAVRRKLQDDSSGLDLSGLEGLEDLLDMFGDGDDAGDSAGADDSSGTDMGFDLSFLDELFGGGGDDSDGSGGGGSIMATMICGMMDFMAGAMDEMADEMGGFSCSKFACNEEKTHLLLECSMDEEVCEGDADLIDVAPRNVEDGEEEYCVENTKVNMSMELNFEGESEVTAKQCSTYTSPADLIELGEGCLDMTIAVDFGSIMDSAMNPDADPAASEQAMQEMTTDFFIIKECSSSFADGTTCDCKTCDGAIGFDLTCSKGGMETFATEECNDFDADSITGSIAQFGGGDGSPEGETSGEVGIPSVGVVRLAKVEVASDEDESSPASSHTGTMAAGLVLTFASFLAIH